MRIRPTSPGAYWLVAAILMAVVGLVKNINLILLVAYFAAVLAVWNLWMCRRAVVRVGLRRKTPRPVFAGDKVPCEYELENRAGFLARDLVIVDTPYGERCEWPAPQVPAKSTAAITRLALAPQRGRFDSPGPKITCAAPFGLMEARSTFHSACTAWVYPRRGWIDIDRLRLRLPPMGSGRERRRALVPLPADGTDIYGLHPFRTGDSPRLIHWKTTARMGQPMVREFDRNSAPDLLATLDARWVADDATGRRFEAAVEFLATLVWSWSTKTEATLTVSFPDGSGTFKQEVSQRWHAHVVLRQLAACTWIPGAANWAFSFDGMSERVPVIMIGNVPVDGRRGLAVDPTRPCEFYRPANWSDS